MRRLRKPRLIKDPKKAVEWLISKATRLNNGCLITHLSRVKGYPAGSINGVNYEAHRFVFSALKGPIPEGLSVLHSCDNKRCIEIEHLRVGTQADNLKEMARKGRGRAADWYTYKWRRDHAQT